MSRIKDWIIYRVKELPDELAISRNNKIVHQKGKSYQFGRSRAKIFGYNKQGSTFSAQYLGLTDEHFK